MKFSIENYKKELALKFANLSFLKNCFVCAWFSERMFEKYANHIEAISLKAKNEIENIIDFLWQNVNNNNNTDLSQVTNFVTKCQNIYWECEAENDEDRINEFGATELLNCLTDSLKFIETRDIEILTNIPIFIINTIDYILSYKYERSYTDQVFNDLLMKTEIKTQADIINFLMNAQNVNSNNKLILR